MPAEKRTFSIPNKIARQRYNVKIKIAASNEKHRFRADRRKEEEKDPDRRRERLKQNIPVTLDRARVWDETIGGAYIALNEQRPKRRKLDHDKDEAEAYSSPSLGPEEDCKGEGQAVEGEVDEEEALAEEAHESAMQAKAVAAETALLFPTIPTTAATVTNLPKLLITTSRNCHMHEPGHELATVFPNSTYIPRGQPSNSVRKGKTKAKQFSIREICEFAGSPPHLPSSSGQSTESPPEPFTHVAVISEHQKRPSGLTVIVLPSGPSFHFSMTNYLPSSAIHNRGRATSHTPELILNNFLTPLGKLAAGLFQSIFPPAPELGGRQVVTLHNQRDYIFFRRHRYIFRERKSGEKAVGYGLDHGQNTANPVSEGVEKNDLGIKVGLQELGPQFTLKLRKVEKGICEGVEWQWKGRMDKERRKFRL